MKTRDPRPLLSEVAYERILQALFDARLQMGAQINQGALVEMTGIPVGPVRDALKLLETDGIVKVHPRSGIEVISPSMDLMRATFQFRSIIERPAARAFARVAPEEDLLELQARHKDVIAQLTGQEPSANVGDILDGVEVDFHPRIVASLNNELVDASYRRLSLMARILKVKAMIYPSAALVSVGEHLAVIEACLRRDPDAAENAMSQHLTNALNRNLGLT
ncbi:GntR family transcriptional regulator [Psychromarinibacter sp. S121]|uniref:GntR family transcriptional regulator n=1 Tax=Psychromarinibacter sp. S121 TaxID=3415127 RepID=UPI003C7BD756